MERTRPGRRGRGPGGDDLLREGAEVADRLRRNVERVVIGKREEIRLVLAALACRGHVLFEDVPGNGEDGARARDRRLDRRRAVSRASSARPTCSRPTSPASRSTTSRRASSSSGRGRSSPTSCSSTRSTARCRRRSRRCSRRWPSARSRSTASRAPLPEPFLLLATENPIEQEGTFPLPEAQLDRFFLRTALGYPTRGRGAADRARAARTGTRSSALAPSSSAEEVRELQRGGRGRLRRRAARSAGSSSSCARRASSRASSSARRCAAASRSSGRRAPGRSLHGRDYVDAGGRRAAVPAGARPPPRCRRRRSWPRRAARRGDEDARADLRAAASSCAPPPEPRLGRQPRRAAPDRRDEPASAGRSRSCRAGGCTGCRSASAAAVRRGHRLRRRGLARLPARRPDPRDRLGGLGAALGARGAATSSSSASTSPRRRRASSSSPTGARRWPSTTPRCRGCTSRRRCRGAAEAIAVSALAARGAVGYLDVAGGDGRRLAGRRPRDRAAGWSPRRRRPTRRSTRPRTRSSAAFALCSAGAAPRCPPGPSSSSSPTSSAAAGAAPGGARRAPAAGTSCRSSSRTRSGSRASPMLPGVVVPFADATGGRVRRSRLRRREAEAGGASTRRACAALLDELAGSALDPVVSARASRRRSTRRSLGWAERRRRQREAGAMRLGRVAASPVVAALLAAGAGDGARPLRRPRHALSPQPALFGDVVRARLTVVGADRRRRVEPCASARVRLRSAAARADALALGRSSTALHLPAAVPRRRVLPPGPRRRVWSTPPAVPYGPARAAQGRALAGARPSSRGSRGRGRERRRPRSAARPPFRRRTARRAPARSRRLLVRRRRALSSLRRPSCSLAPLLRRAVAAATSPQPLERGAGPRARGRRTAARPTAGARSICSRARSRARATPSAARRASRARLVRAGSPSRGRIADARRQVEAAR